MIVELADDLSAALSAMCATNHPKRQLLLRITETIQREVAFLNEFPTLLFQSILNEFAGFAGFAGPDHGDPAAEHLLQQWRGNVHDRKFLIAINPDRKDPRLRRQIHSPHSQITAVATSADESFFVTGGSDRTICVWKRETQSLDQQLVNHDSSIDSLAIHPTSDMILSASRDGSAKVSYRGSPSAQVLETRNGYCFSAAISPDGKWLAGGWYDGTVLVWDAQTPSEARAFSGPHLNVRSLAFSKDSRFLAAGTDDLEVFVWNVDRSTLESRFKAHEFNINDLTFIDRDQKVVTVSDDKTARIWDWKRRSCERVLSGHDTGVSAVACKNDQEIATGSSDHTIRIWKHPYQQCSEVLTGHQNKVTGLHYFSDGVLLSVSEDNTIREWNTGLTSNDHSGGVAVPNCVRLSPDGRFAIVGHGDGTVSKWDAQTATRLASRKLADRAMTCVTISRDGVQCAAGSDSGDAWVFTPDFEVLMQAEASGARGAVDSLAISGTGGLLAMARSDSRDDFSTIEVWSIASETRVGSIRQPRTGQHAAVDINDDGNLLAAATYGRVTLYDRNQDPLGEFTRFTGEVVDLSFQNSGSGLVVCTPYATRSGDVRDESSWQLLPCGGPARAVADRDRFPFWLRASRNHCQWSPVASRSFAAALPIVPPREDRSCFDLSGGSLPILVLIKEGKLAFYKWTEILSRETSPNPGE